MTHVVAVALALVVALSATASPAGGDHKSAGKHQLQKEDQKAEHGYRKQLQKEQHESSKDRQKAGHEYEKRRQRAEHEYGKREQTAEHEHLKREHEMVRFGDRQRRRVVHYYRDNYGYGRGCPPGLRANGTGCAPPGAGKRYAVGRALPGDVSLYPLPDELVVTLSPPPPGFAYGFVDGDLVIYEIPTRVVIDVVVAPF